MFTFMPEPSPLSQLDMARQYETSVGEGLMSGVMSGLTEDTSYGILGRLAGWFRAGAGEELDESKWKASPSYRKGLTWKPGMTAEQAEVLALRHDKTQHRAFQWSKAGKGAMTAMIAGEFIGSIPDPVNFIPILRVGGLAGKIIAKLGPRLGRVAAGAGEAAIGVSLYQPAIAYTAHLEQDEFDLRMAAINIVMAAGIGAGFGAIGAALARRSPEERVRATAKAVADTIQGRPVDVAPAMAPREAVSERLRTYLADADTQAPHTVEKQALRGRALRRAEETGLEAAPARPEMASVLRRFAAVAGLERADVPVIAQALDTPAFARTEGQKAVLDGLDLMPADERALRVWSTAAAERTADDVAFFGAYLKNDLPGYFKARTTLAEQTIAGANKRAAEIDAEVPRVKALIGELDKQIEIATERGKFLRVKPAVQQIAATREALVAKREALVAERVRLTEEQAAAAAAKEQLRTEAAHFTESQPLDSSVAQRPVQELPSVKPTTAENVGEPPAAGDTDFAAVEARFKDMEANGLLPEEAKDVLEAAAGDAEKMDATARAFDLAGLCLARTD